MDMRNLLILIVVLLSVTLYSCNQKEKELKSLRDEVQILHMESTEKDASIASFMESFNEIEKNLAEIRERELNISLQSKENKNPNVQAQIKEDIRVINELIAENNKTIEDLNQQLSSTKNRNVELNRMMTRVKEQLTQQIEEKNNQIALMQEDLERMNYTVSSLTSNLDTLKNVNSQLAMLNEENEGIIEDKTNYINTAYVALGTRKELKDENIIVNEGGFLGIGRTEKLNGNFDESSFMKIDIREMTVIPIDVEAKKIELVTSHPADSYRINKSDKIESIEITQPEKFWNHSKYLVVRVN
jgi:DNA repair exonuclease SbcCD ATPase subunit